MTQTINNAFYDHLGDDWYACSDHPIALLRAENKVRVPWVKCELEASFSGPCKVLDIGCGAGLLTNAIASFHEVWGIDCSQESLDVAKKFDPTKTVKYMQADALALPFKDHSFDVVCAMDILEHVEDAQALIQEASRVLKDQGLFFFHTFNRNWLSYLLIIKGVDWFIPNAPKNMHVYPLFIKPEELKNMCAKTSLGIEYVLGFSPKLRSKEFWRLLKQKKLSDRFPFHFTKNTLIGYSGLAKKIDNRL